MFSVQQIRRQAKLHCDIVSLFIFDIFTDTGNSKTPTFGSILFYSRSTTFLSKSNMMPSTSCS